MRTIELGRFCLGVGMLSIGACSAGSPPSDGAGLGSGGTAASGGSLSVGGGSASGGSGGTGGGIGSGTGGMIAVAGTSSSGGSAGAAICQALSVVPTPQVPTVMLVVDTSSSMWKDTTPQAWPILHTALMDPTNGVVQALDDKIRFGFQSYKGTASNTSTCAEFAKVDPALDNLAAIEVAYGGITYSETSPPKWDTPTHHAIDTAVVDLLAYMPDPPGPKFILLVTDGNPDTCTTYDPNCGHDYSIKAVQDAYAAGVGTFVLGVGDIVVNGNNGCADSARCGAEHLQDIANAGVGAAVQAPDGCVDVTSPDCRFKYEQCNNNTLMSAYVETAPNVGTPYTVDTTSANAPQTLVTTLTGLLSNVISCTVEMDAVVTGNPALGMVTVGGSPVAYNDPNGWTLDLTTKYTVTLTGTACDTFKGGATLDIQFPCDVEGNPIAEPR